MKNFLGGSSKAKSLTQGTFDMSTYSHGSSCSQAFSRSKGSSVHAHSHKGINLHLSSTVCAFVTGLYVYVCIYSQWVDAVT